MPAEPISTASSWIERILVSELGSAIDPLCDLARPHKPGCETGQGTKRAHPACVQRRSPRCSRAGDFQRRAPAARRGAALPRERGLPRATASELHPPGLPPRRPPRRSDRCCLECRPRGEARAPSPPSSSSRRAAAAAAGLERGSESIAFIWASNLHCQARPESSGSSSLWCTAPARELSGNSARWGVVSAARGVAVSLRLRPFATVTRLAGTGGSLLLSGVRGLRPWYSLSKARIPPRIPRMVGIPRPPAMAALLSQFLASPSQSHTLALTVVTWDLLWLSTSCRKMLYSPGSRYLVSFKARLSPGGEQDSGLESESDGILEAGSLSTEAWPCHISTAAGPRHSGRPKPPAPPAL